MTVSTRPLAWEERAWLHPRAVDNFCERAPELPPPDPTHYDAYWRAGTKVPLALLKDQKRVVFAMIRRTPGCAWELAEFYVDRPHRRTGLGRKAARAVLCAKPGAWVLGVARRGNARLFWDATLAGANWVTDLAKGAPFYPAQSHSYTFTTHPSVEDR